MQPIGPKLAEGRDSEIYEHGHDKVLRVARDGRSLAGEAEIMRYVRSHDYPCPEVYDAGDGYLVMERLEGPTMMEAVGKPPFPLRRSGRLLAELHEQLHRIAAPPGIRSAPLPGDRLVHLDLHPLNVMMTSDGPDGHRLGQCVGRRSCSRRRRHLGCVRLRHAANGWRRSVHRPDRQAPPSSCVPEPGRHRRREASDPRRRRPPAHRPQHVARGARPNAEARRLGNESLSRIAERGGERRRRGRLGLAVH